MGEDKGSLVWGTSAVPQVRVAFDHLSSVCTRAYVSIRESQLDSGSYAGLPTIVDSKPDLGPAGGLLTAFDFDASVAWLVVAVDMPFVTAGLLRNLIAQRQPGHIATVHRHADGTIEPLCAIWEPPAHAAIRKELELGRGSLRAVAQTGNAAVAELPEPTRLRNANTPAERSDLQQGISAEEEPSTDGPVQR